MPSAICDNTSMCEAVLKRAVVVMEDSSPAEEAIKEVIEKELGWTVKMAKNSNEVAEYARNGEAAIYILDNKIEDNSNEGLDALEKVKAIDENILVAIFSAYPKYKIQAYRIDKNLVTYEVKQDGTKLKENARHIATAFVNRLRQLFDEMQSKVENSNDECRNITLALIEKEKLELEKNRQALEEAYYNFKELVPGDKKIVDCNFEAYKECKSDPEWLAKYEGKYVAFVDDEQVFPEITDEQELLKLIREKYAKQWRLFTKVQKAGKTRVVKAPSGYSKIKKI
jgi:ActR/RegA family two-component response regulator